MQVRKHEIERQRLLRRAGEITRGDSVKKIQQVVKNLEVETEALQSQISTAQRERTMLGRLQEQLNERHGKAADNVRNSKSKLKTSEDEVELQDAKLSSFQSVMLTEMIAPEVRCPIRVRVRVRVRVRMISPEVICLNRAQMSTLI